VLRRPASAVYLYIDAIAEIRWEIHDDGAIRHNTYYYYNIKNTIQYNTIIYIYHRRPSYIILYNSDSQTPLSSICMCVPPRVSHTETVIGRLSFPLGFGVVIIRTFYTNIYYINVLPC